LPRDEQGLEARVQGEDASGHLGAVHGCIADSGRALDVGVDARLERQHLRERRLRLYLALEGRELRHAMPYWIKFCHKSGARQLHIYILRFWGRKQAAL
jgi:hypothetical protein